MRAFLLALILVVGIIGVASAQSGGLHPAIPLLDADGTNVLESGKPVAIMQTCGGCHDTQFIEQHSFHSQVGLKNMTLPGQAASGRAWDTSNGLFGLWDPITYRYLSPLDDEKIDLTTAEWLQVYGAHHAGGGPAIMGRLGVPLTEMPASADNPETSILDPKTGKLTPWDWKESGTVEMNCFLCHIAEPNNQARIEALQAGDFGWANTATLLGSGVVENSADGLVYNPMAFDEQGNLKSRALQLQSPTSENCGQCHGQVEMDTDQAISYRDFDTNDWMTMRTGQIFSGQRISDSALNIKGKAHLDRSWDVHAERNLQCTDCHYALNNPAYYEPSPELNPKHLIFEPRRPDIADYLQKPIHDFARGAVTKDEVGAAFAGSMRRCESCHDYKSTHKWLPYEDRHAQKLSCESCHIPTMHATAIQQNDWTVLDAQGNGILTYRNVSGDGNPHTASNMLNGFNPVLLPRHDADGNLKLAPFNLVSSWYWVAGDPARPVRQMDLQKAFFDENGTYKAEIVAVFDANGDGALSTAELRMDNDAKEQVVRSQLEALGLTHLSIQAEVEPYIISHDTTWGEYATKDCTACHGDESRISQPMLLADYIPGGVTPELVGNVNIEPAGEMVQGEHGELYYQPDATKVDIFLPGHNRIKWLDWLGVLMMVGVFAGVFIHGGLRIYTSAHGAATHHGKTRKLYLYTFYERLWHWTQAIAIILLILTGIIVHRPDMFGAMDLGRVVPIHNALGFLLLANAFFALFYFLAGNSIQQFLPEPRGFFHQALQQAMFYGQGIFKGEPHPFEKNHKQKMNPLQQMTYLAILNVLLPVQIITGVLIWGAQRWPELASAIGGLRYLDPIHTIAAWSFAAFVIMHMYLTTTGHTITAAVEGMITGWEEVDVEDDDHSHMTTA
jgi:thiosulfate reductase cytochrome b subunit